MVNKNFVKKKPSESNNNHTKWISYDNSTANFLVHSIVSRNLTLSVKSFLKTHLHVISMGLVSAYIWYDLTKKITKCIALGISYLIFFFSHFSLCMSFSIGICSPLKSVGRHSHPFFLLGWCCRIRCFYSNDMILYVNV